MGEGGLVSFKFITKYGTEMVIVTGILLSKILHVVEFALYSSIGVEKLHII